jgi:UDP:flavonoid glycosyltransferase YjiC (YdhE family)
VGGETDIDKLGDIPANCQVAHTVDQIAVLQQADVFVTHCGTNSVSEALYFGVPLVLFPQAPEQQGVANRILEPKAGIALEDAAPDIIRKAVQTVLERMELRGRRRRNSDVLPSVRRSKGGGVY